MNLIPKIFLTFTFLLFQTIFAQEAEKVIVTSFKKGVQAFVGSETIIPKIDEPLPLNAKIQCDKTGYLEFRYKDKEYRIKKNTTILLSDVIKLGGEEKNNVVTKSGSDGGGVRGLNNKNKKNKQ